MRVEGPPSDGQLIQIVTESQNISASGVYCSAPHYLAPLSKVALTIVLPALPGTRGARRLLKCSGVVVRCLASPQPLGDRRYELACSFTGLEERHRRVLGDFVAWRNLQAAHPTHSRGGRRSRTSATSSTAARPKGRHGGAPSARRRVPSAPPARARSRTRRRPAS
jgi:hypothetical protein